MKKFLLFFISTSIFLSLFSFDYYLYRDDLSGNYLYWHNGEVLNSVYLATKFYVSEPCTLKKIEWGRRIGKQLSLTDSIFITYTKNRLPDLNNTICKSSYFIGNTNATNAIIQYNLPTYPIVNNVFWVVIKAPLRNSTSVNFQSFFFQILYLMLFMILAIHIQLME